MKRLGIGILVSLFLSGAVPSIASARPRSGGPIPPMPGLVESWVALFNLNEHVVRVGEILTGTIEIPAIGDCGEGHRCVSRVSVLPGSGLKQLGACDLKHRHCRWKAVDVADPWQAMEMEISTDIGGAVSRDYYMVVDPNTYVLDGTVTGRTDSKGVTGVVLHVRGKQRATASTNNEGYYVVRLKKGDYVVTPSRAGEQGVFAPAHARVHVTRKGRNSQNFWLKKSYPSDLVGVTGNGGQVGTGQRIGAVGDNVSFLGTSWDPDGDPVSVSWDKTRIGSYSTWDSFSGSWRLPVFPDGTCRGTLTAVQGTARKTLVLHANVDGQVAFTNGAVHVGIFAGGHVDPVAGGRALKPKSLLCEGEGAVVGAGGAAIWATASGAFELVSKPKRIHVWGAVTTPSGTMLISRGRRIPFAVGGPDPHSFDTVAKPGRITVSGPTLQASDPAVGVYLTGYFYYDGDLTVVGPLRLDGAVLYVGGNLTISGGLRGVGSVIATGNMTINGPVELKTDNTQALDAGGQLTLNGG